MSKIVMKIGDNQLDIEQDDPINDATVGVVQQFVNALSDEPAQPAIDAASASLDKANKGLSDTVAAHADV